MGIKSYVDASIVAEKLLDYDDFIICGHVSPDGDCIGSQLALWHALKARGKRATCLLAKADSIDKDLRFLPGVDEMVVVDDYCKTPGAAIAVDVSEAQRLGDEVAVLFESCETTFIIDHHEAGGPQATFTYSDASAASATMLVWDVIEDLAVELSSEIATCGYTGLLTDTGRFQFQNTDARAFHSATKMVNAGADPSMIARELFQNIRLATLQLESIVLGRMILGAQGRYAVSYLTLDDFSRVGAVKSDADPLVNTLRSIEGVEVACLIRQTEEGIKGSLRAKNEIDVNAIARSFGGGGHKAASGFSMSISPDKAVKEVCLTLDSLFAS